MEQKARILLVEDDPNFGSVLKNYLELNDYNVKLCSDGFAGYDQFVTGKYDICILDVMLQKMDGYALAEEIRKDDELTPLLFLTSKSGKDDRIKGFETGGDDFITKPFNIEELMLRIEVFLKRSKGNHTSQKVFQFGNTTFDYPNFELRVNASKRKLTEKEADVLYTLCCNLHKIVKRDELLMKVWGSNDYFLGRSLDVFISKLRKYISADPSAEIENHHGVGFKLTVKA